MKVLSLFNGMSCGMMALESLNIPVTKYYSSEIDKYANQAAQALFPDTIQLGDVTNWREWDIDWASIDLVTGGFPCQAWSMAGKQLGDKDERGMLFWTMLDIMKHVKYHNPKADFLIENVKMKKEFEEYITTHTENALGHVHKILINSALVSAQNRNRYYWTSFEVEQPEDKGILLKDIIEPTVSEKYALSHRMITGFFNKKGDFGKRFKPLSISTSKKANTLTARYFKLAITDNYIITGVTDSNGYGVNVRKLTPRECMRLQTVPEHHIDTLLSAGISNTQLYKMTGNGWTVDVIAHILKAKFK
jgi:DNA (cytosine-5)-methyltransferase 1/DNA (cytosine-5)-methyltransferase 3A